MTNNIKPNGYMIQDIQGNAIYGIGSTVEEAWVMVKDGIDSFFDRYGNDISEDEAYLTQFKVFGASDALMAQVSAEGGYITWGEVRGVACTIAEEESTW